jgi:hypothetical protein
MLNQRSMIGRGDDDGVLWRMGYDCILNVHLR